MPNSKQVKLIRIGETAEMLEVHPETLRRWDREGKMEAIIINDRRDRRFKLSVINDYIKTNKNK